jgi:hypothetical protein
MEEIDDLINRYMIPQLLEVNFGPGGPKAEKVTTGFDSRDLETMRAIVGAIANKNGSVPEVDVREMLDQLGIPLLSWQETQRNLEKIAEEQQASSEFELQKLREQAALKGHKVDPGNAQNSGMPTKPKQKDARFGEAGIDEHGRYFNDRERIIIVGHEQTEEDKQTAKMTKDVLEEVKEIKKNLKPQEPPVVNVEVKASEAPSKKVRKTVVRDDDGNITHVDEEEIADEPQA